VPHIISYVPTYKNLDKFSKLGVAIVGGPKDIASFVYNKIAHTKKAIGVGLGKGEIVEITIEEYSPLANKTLAQIALYGIRIGAIYRDNKLIVPTKVNTIKPNDKVLLIGYPDKLSYAINILTSAKIEFPMQYGNTMLSIICKSDSILKEASYIKSSTPVQYIKTITTLKNISDNYAIDEIDYVKSKKEIIKQLVQETFGLLIMEKECFGFLSKIGLKKSMLNTILNNIPKQTPVLLSSSKEKYKTALLYIFENDEELIRKAVHTAISIENTLKLKLDIVVCEQLKNNELSQSVERSVYRIFSIHRKKGSIHIVNGNPVKEFKKLKNSYDLAIITGYRTKNSLFKPNPVYYIANMKNISVLEILK
jgi:hypothetical protein